MILVRPYRDRSKPKKGQSSLEAATQEAIRRSQEDEATKKMLAEQEEKELEEAIRQSKSSSLLQSSIHHSKTAAQEDKDHPSGGRKRPRSPAPLPNSSLQSSASSSSVHSAPTPNSSMSLAKSQSHPSHQLFYKQGVIYCRACGNYGTVKFLSLLKVCKRPLNWKSSMGYKNLVRIFKGQAPSPLEDRPLHLFEAPPEGPI